MKIFNLKPALEKNLVHRCGITDDEVKGMFTAMLASIKDTVKNYKVEENIIIDNLEVDYINIDISPSELVQVAAEYLNRELTPEIGLVIGLLLSDIENSAEMILKEVIDQLKEEEGNKE